MKTSPLPLLVGIAACAISAFAGYHFGQSGAPDAAETKAANAKAAAKSALAGTAANPKINLDDLLKGPGLPDAEALAHWAKNLSPQECAALLTQLQSMKGGAVRDSVLQAVLVAWAKKDPQGMIAASTTVNSPHLRENGMDAALKAWAAQDPASALKWLKDNPGTASTAATEARYNAAIAGFAAADPKGAFDLVNSMSDGNARDKQSKIDALKAVSDALADQGRFSDALQLFGTLPAGDTRDESLDHLAKSWAASSPDDATAWAAGITDPAEKLRLEGSIADSWAASDPAAAAKWAAQLDADAYANRDPNAPASKSPLDGPGTILANAILAWSKDDLDGPGNFLNELPASPDKDRAVAVFAMHAGEEDPESAAKWIGTVTDPKIKSGVTMVVAMQMYQQDPVMFNNFVNNTDMVPAAQKQSLQQLAPMLSQSMALLKTMGGQGGDPMSNIMESVLTGKTNPMTSLMRNTPPGTNPFMPARPAASAPNP